MIAIILAAGKGTRLGQGFKAFVEIQGETLLEKTASVFKALEQVDMRLAVVPKTEINRSRDLLGPDWQVLAGGEQRMDSLGTAVEFIKHMPASTVVLVHDVARPFVKKKLCEEIIEDFENGDADLVAPAIEAVDAAKFIGKSGNYVVASISKQRVRLVQTPQLTRLQVLIDGLTVAQQTGRIAVDEAQLVEWLGGRVHLIPGDQRNFKITTPFDLKVARCLASGGECD